MTIKADTPEDTLSDDALAALVRVLLSLKAADVLRDAKKLDYWSDAEGGWILEWRGGPSAAEAYTKLVRDAHAGATDSLAGRITHSDTSGADVEFAVNGVRVLLRALRPTGHLKLCRDVYEAAPTADSAPRKCCPTE
jgi:hypothetical protein